MLHWFRIHTWGVFLYLQGIARTLGFVGKKIASAQRIIWTVAHKGSEKRLNMEFWLWFYNVLMAIATAYIIQTEVEFTLSYVEQVTPVNAEFAAGSFFAAAMLMSVRHGLLSYVLGILPTVLYAVSLTGGILAGAFSIAAITLCITQFVIAGMFVTGTIYVYDRIRYNAVYEQLLAEIAHWRNQEG